MSPDSGYGARPPRSPPAAPPQPLARARWTSAGPRRQLRPVRTVARATDQEAAACKPPEKGVRGSALRLLCRIERVFGSAEWVGQCHARVSPARTSQSESQRSVFACTASRPVWADLRSAQASRGGFRRTAGLAASARGDPSSGDPSSGEPPGEPSRGSRAYMPCEPKRTARDRGRTPTHGTVSEFSTYNTCSE